jgi:signal transduction histidine kinase
LTAVRVAPPTRIARELHDELAQWLTALKMDVAWLAARLPSGSSALTQRTEKMKQLVDTTVAAVRRIAADLRPVMLDDLGLMPALEHLLHQFSERANIAVSLNVEDASDFEFGDPLSTALYRIVQEALTNVARHADASEVELALKLDGDHLYLHVRDNGRGLPASVGETRSYGLMGIKERAQTLGGRANIYSPTQGGTIVEIIIPVARYREARRAKASA